MQHDSSYSLWILLGSMIHVLLLTPLKDSRSLLKLTQNTNRFLCLQHQNSLEVFFRSKIWNLVLIMTCSINGSTCSSEDHLIQSMLTHVKRVIRFVLVKQTASPPRTLFTSLSDNPSHVRNLNESPDGYLYNGNEARKIFRRRNHTNPTKLCIL